MLIATSLHIDNKSKTMFCPGTEVGLFQFHKMPLSPFIILVKHDFYKNDGSIYLGTYKLSVSTS